MSQKHWTFTNIIRYIEEYERNPLLIERMKWKSIPEGECIVEFVKLCEHLVLERTIEPKNHQATAIYLRYSQQLLLKKQAKDRGMPLFTLMFPPCPASLWISSSPPEQNAIATALSNMDSELSVLEARRDKARNLKQAMMQCLLIGRTRFI